MQDCTALHILTPALVEWKLESSIKIIDGTLLKVIRNLNKASTDLVYYELILQASF